MSNPTTRPIPYSLKDVFQNFFYILPTASISIIAVMFLAGRSDLFSISFKLPFLFLFAWVAEFILYQNGFFRKQISQILKKYDSKYSLWLAIALILSYLGILFFKSGIYMSAELPLAKNASLILAGTISVSAVLIKTLEDREDRIKRCKSYE